MRKAWVALETWRRLFVCTTLLCACLDGFVACRRAEHTPNVVLVTLDTTRADHVGHLGYHRLTTPNLDRLAEQGVTYTRAYATSSWTAPSHGSIFTSLLPSEHGCRRAPAALS